jgi:hypothetical protein
MESASFCGGFSPVKRFVAACTASIVSIVLFALSADLRAQSPATPRTNAELRTRVAELEQQLLKLLGDHQRLESDYKVLLTATCPTPSPAPLFMSPPAPTTPIASTATPETDLPPGFIKSVEFGVTERNRVFWRYAWNVTVYNGGSDRRHTFDVVMQFLDQNGLVIDTDRAYRQTVDAFAERTLRGAALVGLPEAVNVASVHAIVTPR